MPSYGDRGGGLIPNFDLDRPELIKNSAKCFRKNSNAYILHLYTKKTTKNTKKLIKT